jgi:flavodoxin I
LYHAFGSDVAAEPVDVDTLEAGSLAQIFGQHNALVCGTPTWNTGAETERSGTGWDDLYYDKLPQLKDVLAGKKCAVFGLGDQVSYAENYADAAGELYDVFTELGCDMVRYAMTRQDGYEHQSSKSIRGDKFCGLLLDQINQEDLTDERISVWVSQLLENGFLDGGTRAVAPLATNPVEDVAVEESVLKKVLETSSTILDETIVSHSSFGFTPHFNPVTRKTMWTSSDGRSSYVTADPESSTSTSNLRP